MRSEELLALGMFGRGSRLGDRMARLLDRGREFSPEISKMRLTVIAAALAGCVVAAAVAPRMIAFAQARQRLTFDAASIRPSMSGERPNFIIGSGGRLTVTAWAMKPMIQKAYDVPGFFVSGGPNWINFDRYDIDAKAGDSEGDTADQRQAYERRMLLRMQSLLGERFHLELRKVSKQLAGYALLLSKDGPKLQPADENSPAIEGLKNPDGSKRPGILARGGVRDKQGRFLGGGTMRGQMATMAMLADILTRNLGMPVADKTGLTGKYDFSLEYAPDAVPQQLDAAIAETGAGQSLATALQTLGLKLKSAKVPATTWVIEHVERPDAN